MASVFDCSIIELSKITNRSGNLTVVENFEKALPFKVKGFSICMTFRVGIAGSASHKQCHQMLIAASGSFEILLDDGKTKRQIQLNRAEIGLHIPPKIWASEVNFSSGSICLVLVSHIYIQNLIILEIMRRYLEFRKMHNI